MFHFKTNSPWKYSAIFQQTAQFFLLFKFIELSARLRWRAKPPSDAINHLNFTCTQEEYKNKKIERSWFARIFHRKTLCFELLYTEFRSETNSCAKNPTLWFQKVNWRQCSCSRPSTQLASITSVWKIISVNKKPLLVSECLENPRLDCLCTP